MALVLGLIARAVDRQLPSGFLILEIGAFQFAQGVGLPFGARGVAFRFVLNLYRISNHEQS